MEVVLTSAALAHVPLVEVGHLRREVGGSVPVAGLGTGRQRVPERVGGGRDVACGAGGGGRWRGLAVDLHVLSQGAGVCVGLVAAPHLAVVRLVAGVDVRVLLPVAAVGKFSVTAVELTLKRFLSLSDKTNKNNTRVSVQLTEHQNTHNVELDVSNANMTVLSKSLTYCILPHST